MSHPFHIVDVFAERRFGGNQLAVVLDADDLTGETMQQIALETNFSETTFVLRSTDRGRTQPVRIFTPTMELPFAGHPTIGTAWVLRERAGAERPDRVTLALGVGPVPVRFETPDPDGLAWLEAPQIELQKELPRELIAGALGLEPSELDDAHPPQLVSAGFPTVICPVADRDVLRRARLRAEALPELDRAGVPPFVYLFCRDAAHPEVDVSSRFFFDAGGVREDPATGSATACLGGYLLRHRYLGEGSVSIQIEQAADMGRPSCLSLSAERSDAGARIEVGGRVIPFAEGTLRV